MCVCNTGYEGTGLACADVDECAAAPSPCAPGACTNTDAADCIDGCPNDPLKIAPGICGCGVADTDSDSDGTADCNDGCPSDPLKSAPGACGCGSPETDSDFDGTPNCVDGCPSDPLKSAPGACGCGTPDTDSDGDGTPNCTDGCPSDPLKTSPGTCGCGVPETGAGSSSTIGEPRTSSYTEGPFFRGNAYQVTTSRVLQSFEQYLSLPASCSVGFYVLRGSSATGPWTTVWSRAQTRSGAAYHSSGTIDITLSAGYHYALGVGWSCSATYQGNTGTWGGHATNIGAFRGNIWDNSYPGYTTVYSPPNAGGSALAYAQRITTGGCP